MPASLTYVNTVATLGAAGGVAYTIMLLAPKYKWLALVAALLILVVGLGLTAWLHFQPVDF